MRYQTPERVRRQLKTALNNAVFYIVLLTLLGLLAVMLSPAASGQRVELGQVGNGEAMIVRVWDGCKMAGYFPIFNLAMTFECLGEVNGKFKPEINGPATVVMPFREGRSTTLVVSGGFHDCGGNRYLPLEAAPNIVGVLVRGNKQNFVIKSILLGGGPYRHITVEKK